MAPSLAKAIAVAAPMPLDAPVMTTRVFAGFILLAFLRVVVCGRVGLHPDDPGSEAGGAHGQPLPAGRAVMMP